MRCTKWHDLVKWKKCLEIYSKCYRRRIHHRHIQNRVSNTSGLTTRKRTGLLAATAGVRGTEYVSRTDTLFVCHVTIFSTVIRKAYTRPVTKHHRLAPHILHVTLHFCPTEKSPHFSLADFRSLASNTPHFIPASCSSGSWKKWTRHLANSSFLTSLIFQYHELVIVNFTNHILICCTQFFNWCNFKIADAQLLVIAN